MSTLTAPFVGRITREDGIAGQFALRVCVQYPDEPMRTVRFVTSTYGGPIVMVANGVSSQMVISREVRDRLGGTLDAEWVRAFFAPTTAWN